MEIKVGQWVRDKDNSIIIIKDYLDLESAVEVNVKVTNTPQELIKEKDLLMYQDNLVYVYAIIDKLYFQDKRGYAYKFDLCSKIWTLNSNGGYDLQWEEE